MSEFEIVKAKRETGGRKIEVLSLKGQLDAHTFPSLQKELEALAEEDEPRVVLDCEHLEYISSAGLGVLKKMTREFRDRKGDIRLAALPPKINNVVSLLGFDQVIQVFGGLTDAVDSYRE